MMEFLAPSTVHLAEEHFIPCNVLKETIEAFFFFLISSFQSKHYKHSLDLPQVKGFEVLHFFFFLS